MPRKPNIDPAQRAYYAAAVARLTALEMRQEDIKDKLGITQPDVSRLLRTAEDLGYRSRPQPVFRRDRVPPEILERIEQRWIQDLALEDKLATWAPKGHRCRLHVIDARDSAHFARCAAQVVEELLLGRRLLVGVLWGSTLASIVAAIEEHHADDGERGDRPTFVPVCGEPVYLENLKNLQCSASSLAARLERAIGGRQDRGGSLSLVPAYVSSKHFSPAEMAAILKFVGKIPGYMKIFGQRDKHGAPRNPHSDIARLDAVITGIGVLPQSKSDIERGYAGTFLHERVVQGDTDWDELDDLCLGDLGGVLIGKPGVDGAKIRKLNKGLTGILERDFRTIAGQPDKPGVIVVANQPARAKAALTLQIIRSGLVNHVVVSRALADVWNKGIA